MRTIEQFQKLSREEALDRIVRREIWRDAHRRWGCTACGTMRGKRRYDGGVGRWLCRTCAVREDMDTSRVVAERSGSWREP